MRSTVQELAQRYETALRAYLTSGEETFLQRGYQFGREALEREGGILGMSTLHNEALAACLRDVDAPEERERMLRAATDFFAEALSPFEMAYRQFIDVISVQRRLNELLEEEATRIAHALHDDAGQILASLHINIVDIARELPPPVRQRLQSMRELLNQVEGQIRRISHELRPVILDDLGLVPALEFLAEGVTTRTGLHIEVKGLLEDRLPRPMEMGLYRIAQEALSNVAKHAQAANVTIHLQREPKMIHMIVRDDGVGFDASYRVGGRRPPGLGLIGIRERIAALGGNVQITSAPSQGTEIRVSIPLET